MNAPQNRYKMYNFTLTMSSTVAIVSAVWDDSGRRLPAVRSIKLIVRNFRRKSSNVCFLIFLSGYSLLSLRVKIRLDFYIF